MAKDKFDPNIVYQRIKNALLEEQKKIFQTENPIEVKIQIRPNKQVPRGKFKEDPLIPGGHIAHPVTIRAVRKDLFMAGDDFSELEKLYTCNSCKKILDLQFWHFCPYCETPFDLDEE